MTWVNDGPAGPRAAFEAMNALEPLFEEHRQMRVTLGVMGAWCDAHRADRQLNPEPFLAFHRFITQCVEAHHVTEEQGLFRELVVQAGLPADAGPLGRLLREHELGRELAEAMGAAARACVRGSRTHQLDLLGYTMAYCRLERSHLDQEDLMLYPLALELLGPQGVEGLSPLFRQLNTVSAKAFAAAANALVDSTRARRLALVR